MNKQDDGGPAFPAKAEYKSSTGTIIPIIKSGMSLRDYFAAKAMQGILASWPAGARITIEKTPEVAYQFADAMLAERNKQ